MQPMKNIFNLDLKNYRVRDLAVPLGIMAGLLAAVFVTVQFLGRAERVTITEPLYQFVFEDADRYPEGITMKKSEDQVLVDNGTQTCESDGTPFYFEGRDTLILPESFLYLDRNGEIGGKVAYFTELSLEGGRYVCDDGSNVSLGGGMLHNGRDVYVFLEDTTVTYNGKTKEIGGLSTVVCFQGESVLICPYKETAIYETLGGEGASAVMENGIKVDLANDIYYKANGTKHLLFSDPEIFEPIKGEQEAKDED